MAENTKHVEKFRRKDAKKITGIPARRIQFLTDNGVLLMEGDKPGRGRERRYSHQNLFELMVIKELSHHKVELSRIKEIMVDLPQKYPTINKTRLNFELLIKPETPKHSIILRPEGRVSFFSNRDPKTFDVTETINLDMKSDSSVLIINISKIANDLMNSGFLSVSGEN